MLKYIFLSMKKVFKSSFWRSYLRCPSILLAVENTFINRNRVIKVILAIIFIMDCKNKKKGSNLYITIFNAYTIHTSN